MRHRKLNREKWSRNANAARERKRLAHPAPDYPAALPYGSPMLFIDLRPGWLVRDTRSVCLLKTRWARRFALTVDGEPWMVKGKPLVCGIAEAFARISRRVSRPLPERCL